MGTVLVTVDGPGSRVDLALPDDSAVGTLIPAVVASFTADPPPWGRWALGPLGGEPFPPGRSLADLGVMDGSELGLRDMASEVAGSGETDPGWSSSPVAGEDPEREARRRRITDLVERTVDDLARILAGSNPTLDYASPEARRRLRSLAPGALDQGSEGKLYDLGLGVRWGRDPAAPVAATAAVRQLPGEPGQPGQPRPGSWPLIPRPSGRSASLLTLHLLVDAHCRYLLELAVSREPLPAE